jgi:hypothetical protein
VIADYQPLAELQPQRLQFRSQVWPGVARRRVELAEGVRRVYQRQLADFANGQLPAPVLRIA